MPREKQVKAYLEVRKIQAAMDNLLALWIDNDDLSPLLERMYPFKAFNGSFDDVAHDVKLWANDIEQKLAAE